MRIYARQVGDSLEMQNMCCEIKLRAERRGGEMLREMELRGGDRKSNSHDGSLKLSDMDLNLNQSSRWQLEAALPEEKLDEYIATQTAAKEEITTADVLRLARSYLAGGRAMC